MKKFFNQVSRIEETIYTLLEVDPLFNVEISDINYQEAVEFDGYKKAIFNITVRNAR